MTAAVNQNSAPTLSVVIPCYNEGENVPLLFARLLPALEGLGVSFEVICINDGSRDDTLDRLLDLQKGESRLRVIDLSRNFGKEKALSAGLFHSRGQAVVPMDADLQHPPEAIAHMLAKWRDGYEVVFARRDARTGQGLSEKIFAKGFYWVFDHLSDVRLPREVGDFRLMDRKVVDTINQMPERSRFMKGIFAWVGYRQAEIIYHQGERAAGTTKFNSLKLLGFAFDGLTSFSNFPLRVWGWVGAMVSSLAFLYIVFRLIRTMIWGIDVPGYESTLMSVLFLGGIQLLTLGIIGDYLGRVFDEVKGRPLFIVRQLYEPAGKDDGTTSP
ncbi:glycosyltransferase family 2 protein [Paramagnetospirillum magneticum]|nr:glycosyltransferase family 2 protein [Paramagnetospirillum magneticum]